MLIAEGVSARREYASELDIRAAKLGVTLMLPLGVCILPAFIVLSVIPMMVSLFQHSTIW
jgi:tight adherence protein B